MGLYGEVEFSLVFSDFLATLNLTVTERVVATITKKKEFSFSGVAEEVAATITVGVLLSYQPLTQCRCLRNVTAPIMGLCYNKFFSFKGLTNRN
jgi:hypothetical protein